MNDRPTAPYRPRFFSLPTKQVVAAKTHFCTWCNRNINKGDTYEYWRSVGDGFTENRMHHECLMVAIADGTFQYKAYKNKHPSWAAKPRKTAPDAPDLPGARQIPSHL